jgi:hypothetical protein
VRRQKVEYYLIAAKKTGGSIFQYGVGKIAENK